MIYDTLYRHNQALSPAGLEAIPAALHALNAAVDDCTRAGKSVACDAAVILLIHNLADIVDRHAPDVDALRIRCMLDRSSVEAAPAFLAIAGNSVGGNAPAKRTFHYQTRRALTHLADAIGLEPTATQITSALGADHEDGTSQLAHPDVAIRVVPRAFLAGGEVSFNRCDRGEAAGRVHHAPIVELIDPIAFARRLAGTVGGRFARERLAA